MLHMMRRTHACANSYRGELSPDDVHMMRRTHACANSYRGELSPDDVHMMRRTHACANSYRGELSPDDVHMMRRTHACANSCRGRERLSPDDVAHDASYTRMCEFVPREREAQSRRCAHDASYTRMCEFVPGGAQSRRCAHDAAYTRMCECPGGDFPGGKQRCVATPRAARVWTRPPRRLTSRTELSRLPWALLSTGAAFKTRQAARGRVYGGCAADL
jgi:hypothetical protein